jgi:hypothetical protein
VGGSGVIFFATGKKYKKIIKVTHIHNKIKNHVLLFFI